MAKYHLKRVLWATSLFIVSSLWASPTTSHVLWYNGDAGTEFTNALP
ncbi:MAG: hypothetical protein HUK20_04060, partial [Fibrobacter sp.]|nr:hypothetical protein [Fibrobacter sp.]